LHGHGRRRGSSLRSVSAPLAVEHNFPIPVNFVLGESESRTSTGVRVRSDMSSLSALSRREEDSLLKTVKARALKECDPLVKGAHLCAMSIAV
jgi:hypothetical protein